jgi:hypothetical protein
MRPVGLAMRCSESRCCLSELPSTRLVAAVADHRSLSLGAGLRVLKAIWFSVTCVVGTMENEPD